MLPLQAARIYDYQQPTTDTSRQDVTRASQTPPDRNANEVSEIAEERRKLTDRRLNDRRERQQAIFLNTRKIQGRRRTAGRRLSDTLNTYTPISLKG
jgi:hypothetical protein